MGLGTKRYIFWDYVRMCTYVPNFKLLKPRPPPPPSPQRKKETHKNLTQIRTKKSTIKNKTCCCFDNVISIDDYCQRYSLQHLWHWLMNCFYGIGDQRKPRSHISIRDNVSHPHHHESPTQLKRDPLQTLSSGFLEWSCAVAVTTTSKDIVMDIMDINH